MTAIGGIIFDMDNTLLESRIDFPGMKADVYAWLEQNGLLPEPVDPSAHTTSTLVELARTHGLLTPTEETRLWERIAGWEEQGMAGAVVEADVKAFLREWSRRCVLAVLTNNAFRAAEWALRLNGIQDYFRFVCGREQAGALKPSPLGVRRIMGAFPDIAREQWISVGDSWIDGKASQEAGISFVSYKGDRHKMAENGVAPAAFINKMEELARWLESKHS